MKLLADENFPPSLIARLQKKRHDVKRIQRATRGISDINVRFQALKENRIIITFDKDFLKIEHGEEAVSIMLFSFPQFTSEEIAPFLGGAIDEIKKLKRKKKPFIAIYSEEGVTLIKEKALKNN